MGDVLITSTGQSFPCKYAVRIAVPGSRDSMDPELSISTNSLTYIHSDGSYLPYVLGADRGIY